jgi:hypothetical protein
METKSQDYFEVIEKQDFYEIIENKYGEIAIFIDAREGIPEDPRLFFDGKKTALLRRNSELSIKLENVHKEAKNPLAEAEIVMIIELSQGSMVQRVYGVPLENVEEIEYEGSLTRGDEIRKAKTADDIFSKFGVTKRWPSGEKA